MKKRLPEWDIYMEEYLPEFKGTVSREYLPEFRVQFLFLGEAAGFEALLVLILVLRITTWTQSTSKNSIFLM